MRRRDFLSRAWLSGITLLAGCATERQTASPAAVVGDPSRFVTYVPGYLPKRAYYQGQTLAAHPRFNEAIPAGYHGPVTMITRVDHPGGHAKRAVFPIKGHAIAVRGRFGFFGGMNHPNMLSFDTETLAMVAQTQPAREHWVCGGHGAFTADGRHLLISERSPYAAFGGRPSEHFGMVTVREPESLKVIEHFSCGGIAPHEIALMADGKHIAVANYGSLKPTGTEGRGVLPEMVEPCITVLELANGRLVHKIHAPDKRYEVRHLAAANLERTMAIQARLGALGDDFDLMAQHEEVYVHDFTAEPNSVYLPAPVLRLITGANGDPNAKAVAADDPLLMRHGLSIVYDPRFDEFIATFPTANCFMVFAGDGALRRIVLTEPLGLSYPCGVALHPDGVHYVVTGGWRGLYLFARGSHALNRDAADYTLFFGHSHIAVS